MAILKGLKGNPTILVESKARAFTAYGMVETGGAFSMSAGDTGVFTPPEGPADKIEIVTPPSTGRAVARSDGRISLDFNDDPTPRDETIAYKKTVGGTTTQHTVTVTLTDPKNTLGWDVGRAYNLEVDSNNATVVDPPEVFRPIYVADGSGHGTDYTWWDKDAIIVAEPALPSGASVDEVGYQIALNKASGQGWHYGDDPSRPVSQDVAERAAQAASTFSNVMQITKGNFRLLYRYGETFARAATSSLDGSGESALHPNLIGAWGDASDGLPLFVEKVISVRGQNNIYQDMKCQGPVNPTNFVNLILDNLWMDGQALSANSTTDELSSGFTMRRFRGYDSAPEQPTEGRTYWVANPDRQSGAYFANIAYALVEDIYIDRGGWVPGYRADKKYDVDGTFYPKPPDVFSQNMYTQVENVALTFRNFISTRASLSALQVRAGGIVDGFLSLGNNAGITMGPGWFNSGDALKNGPLIGNWSMMNNTAHSWAGLRDTLDGQVSTTAGGHTFGAGDLSIQNSIIINSARPAGYTINVFSSGSDLGPGVSPNANTYRAHGPYTYPWSDSLKDSDGNSFNYGNVLDNDLIVTNWNRAVYPDENTRDATGTPDALHIGLYADTLLGQSGSYLDEFCDYLRTLNAPWDEMQGALNYFLDPFGRGVSARGSATTVTFRPHPAKRTPGIRADIGLDWDTGDLPGAVPGDSIDLDGHRVNWNMTPKNSIANLTFGKGGELVIWGGALKPTGSVNLDDAGNAMRLHQGSKFHIDGYSGVGKLTVETIESRFLNTGTVLGGIDVKSRYRSEIIFGYDTASWTAASGDTITIYGHSKNGFDGGAGGAASLTLQSGSTLKFLPSALMQISNRPIASEPIQIGFSGPAQILRQPRIFIKEGATIRKTAEPGVTATAHLSNRTSKFVADDLTGAFQSGDSINGEGTASYVIPQGDITLGTLSRAPDVQLGVIREVRTGINGTTPPNVVSTVNLGGTLHVDVTGIGEGTYTLIDVDTVTGTFDAVTAAGNVSKDLTITITGTQVILNIKNGAGKIEGGT